MKMRPRKKRWVFISLAVVIAMMFNSTAVFASVDQVPEGIHGYYTYNAETGEEIYHDGREFAPKSNAPLVEMSSPEYNPYGDSSPLSEITVSPNAIVGGEDNRVKVANPKNNGAYRSIVCLTMYFESGIERGTGFIIGPKAVATAGHCLYDYENKEWATKVFVSPARAGYEHPYSTDTVTSSSSFEVGEEWKNSGKWEGDWGIIKLNKNFNTGWLGLKTQSSSYVGENAAISGYPISAHGVDNNTVPYMYTDNGVITKDRGTQLLEYKIDATKGQSGAPVRANYSDTGYTAIAIHRGTEDFADCNVGVRLYPWLYNKLVSYR